MMSTFTEQIREAIRQSGLSQFAISRLSGVDQAALSRFMSGRRGLTLKSIDGLAEVLNLSVAVGEASSKQVGTRKGKKK